MKIVRTIADLMAAVADARVAGGTVGLVPTMGAFHEGHLTLMRRAREANGTVVVSLFVNPTQFGPAEDLTTYPRDEERDAALAQAEGVDILFAPSVDQMYPAGFATTIHVSGVTDVLCGAHRGPHHFDGVATVVTRLFGLVRPDVAYFGQKDAQQVIVVRRVVRDLALPVRVESVPIVREADGLAMSSRNVHLDTDARQRALGLNRALAAAQTAVDAGERDAAAVLAAARADLDAAGVDPEYLELRDPDDLHELTRLDRPALLAVAARVGATRLIDNRLLTPPTRSDA
ncbi:pantoate--beta-alanine ligase [Tersicoccus sp. MR15.9]|uniref:pantoate--beta-alanine ligase n=1 Tax=Tersicoccus mangrovi TaxID=3121635 RepID=UPI002FE510AD